MSALFAFIRENFRIFTMLVVAAISALVAGGATPDTGPFFDYFFQNFSFTLGMLFPVLAGYIGERRLIAIEPNQTLTASVAVVTVLLPILQPGVDWSSVLQALNVFAASGQLTFGAVFGVLVNYFSDIRIGRPVGSESFANTRAVKYFRLRDLPTIIVYGKAKNRPSYAS